MIKVKIFSANGLAQLENAINEFIANGTIEVIDVKYNIAPGIVASWTALLIYKQD